MECAVFEATDEAASSKAADCRELTVPVGAASDFVESTEPPVAEALAPEELQPAIKSTRTRAQMAASPTGDFAKGKT